MKSIFEIDIDDKTEDKRLLFYGEWASSWIEEVLHRDFTYKNRIQYVKGTGTQRLNLRNRPVYPLVGTANAITVTVDESGNYGQAVGAFSNTPLVYGTDYCLQLDGDEATTSRSGILIRLNNLWPRPFVRQAGYLSSFVTEDTGSIKVSYVGGYTIDTLPGQLRYAADLLVAKIRHLFPLGVELAGEGYEERSLSFAVSRDNYIMATVKPMILNFRNWSF